MGTIKKIYDSVHRFIHIDPIESALINTRPFQRLHYIHQLGVTYFVYPGGTHRRFEHSLGVMELATRIYDGVTTIDETEPLSEQGKKLLQEHIPPKGSPEHQYWRRVLRMAALCHDLGHLPFSHTAEHRLLGKGGHERYTLEFIKSSFLKPIWEMLEKEVKKESVQEDVTKLALGEKKYAEVNPDAPPFTPWERIVTSIITGDFFGSDRIDYLLRDSKYTGLTYGLFDYHQLIEMLKIIPAEEGTSLSIGALENGIESCEALLLARHYMHKRLYQYASVKSYSFHLARFMETMYKGIGEDLSHYIAMTDNEVLCDVGVAALQPSHPGHFDAACLYLRNQRFSAIPLSAIPDEEVLFEIQKKFTIPQEEIAWEIAKSQGKRLGLNFPVLCQEGRIGWGEEFSEISIPTQARSWVYVSPQYESEARNELRSRALLG